MKELQRSQMRGDVVYMRVWLGMGGAVGNNNQNIHGKTGPGCFQGNQTRDRAPTPQLDLPWCQHGKDLGGYGTWKNPIKERWQRTEKVVLMGRCLDD